LLVDALLDVQGAEIAFSPGFRWGTTLLPGQAITREWLLDMTATTYSYATVTEMTGETIKTVLECGRQFVQPRSVLPARW
jgi:sulfur-oxidizing protein SoxB